MLDHSRNWLAADLQRLIQDQVQESIGLEYKNAGALGKQGNQKTEIAKDVSSFANSAGGVIVYGMTEVGHVPTAISPIDAQAFSKEWMENVIISNVQPRIDDLHINPVQLANTGVAYVVTVPQSYTAHQASDNRYYKRFNFQSVPMEHYEVQDTMNRAKAPIINVHMKSQRSLVTNYVQIYSLQIFLENRGSIAAKNIKLVLAVPSFLKAKMVLFAPSGVPVVTNPGDIDFVSYVLRLSEHILFPQDTMNIGEGGAGCTFEIEDSHRHSVFEFDPLIEWTIYADDMPKIEGAVRVVDLIDY